MAALEDPPPYCSGYSPVELAMRYLGGLADLQEWRPLPCPMAVNGREPESSEGYVLGGIYARGLCDDIPTNKYVRFRGYLPLRREDIHALVYVWLVRQIGNTYMSGGALCLTYELATEVTQKVGVLLDNIMLCNQLGIPPVVKCPLVVSHDVEGMRPGDEPLLVYDHSSRFIGMSSKTGTLLGDDDERKHLFGYQHRLARDKPLF